MLSDRIKQLFLLLQCTNTDIARFSGCTPSNISRLKSGLRDPGEKSKSIRRLAEGIYDYADYEGQLSVLTELLGTEETEKEAVVGLLICWLYETKDPVLPAFVEPKSRQLMEKKKRRFGERLNQCMELLSLSNAKLAFRMKVDASLISRYRNSMHLPSHGNTTILQSLVTSLYADAQKKGKLTALASLLHISRQELSPEALKDWLINPYEDGTQTLAEPVLQSIEAFRPAGSEEDAGPVLPKLMKKDRYFGTQGLRNAAARFLMEAVRQGGELLLYSDEPMEWMSGDREYFALWAYLMTEAVRHGVSVRIIHNIDRNPAEMASAIIGWFPLYISGRIEPYEYPKEQNVRFCHTLFLHRGVSCIHGFFPSLEETEDRWYDYVTDEKRLHALDEQLSFMFSQARPFLRVFTADRKKAYDIFCEEAGCASMALFTGLPLALLPAPVLNSMLKRSSLSEKEKREVRRSLKKKRERFASDLKENHLHLILSAPGPEAELSVDLSAELLPVTLRYTMEERRAHLQAVTSLLKSEPHFHLTVLTDSPFRDIRILIFSEAVIVLRSREPYMAFAFQNRLLTRSVTAYLEEMVKSHPMDRTHALKELEKIRSF